MCMYVYMYIERGRERCRMYIYIYNDCVILHYSIVYDCIRGIRKG